jgi:hypothetical protein
MRALARLIDRRAAGCLASAGRFEATERADDLDLDRCAGVLLFSARTGARFRGRLHLCELGASGRKRPAQFAADEPGRRAVVESRSVRVDGGLDGDLWNETCVRLSMALRREQ